MQYVTPRQVQIFQFIQKKGSASNQEIRPHLEGVSRTTIVRDLDQLVEKGLIAAEGKGRSVRYREKISNELLRYIDVEDYFAKGPDERTPMFDRFRFDIFEHLRNIFIKDELQKLTEQNETYRKRVQTLSQIALKKEFERLTIELSWKSSRIEGNTYSLLDTELLLREHVEAPGHPKEETVMIMNHKAVLDYIIAKRDDFQSLNFLKIEGIHDLIVKNLNVQTGIRKKPIGIVGTRYRPIDNEHQIREALEKTIKAINGATDPFSKALIAIVLISYIQPFEDGNKRTARLLGNALLLAYNACPLSFRSVKETEYKKALILFYEQNNVRSFKELLMEQFVFAVENYFLA